MKKNYKFDVAGLGVCSMDYLGIVPHYPKIDTKTEMIEFTKQSGGLVGTALTTLARLGAKVCYIGKLGDDDFSNFLINDFKKEGVGIKDVIIEPKSSTYFSFCLVEKKSGKRTIVLTRKNVKNVKEKEIPYQVIASSQYLLVDQYDLGASIAAAKYAKEHNVKVVAVVEAMLPKINKLLNLIDILIPNEKFALKYTGEKNFTQAAKKLFQSKNYEIVVVTAGKKGCVVVTKEGVSTYPAFKVKVVDTTGAGDAFHGAFIYGMLKNWDLEKIAKFSNAVASINCTRLGGRSSLPNLREVNKFLDERRGK